MRIYRHFIDNEWVEASSGQMLETDDPAVGRPWAMLARGDATDADRAVGAAYRALKSGPWPKLSATQRGAMLHRLGDLMFERAAELAETEVTDNGKRLVEALGQFRYTPQWFHYYGGLADKIEGSVPPLDHPGIINLTRYEPIGVVVAITPWNSPLWLLAWKIAPALAAGNTVVVKPSEYASASTLEFAEIVRAAGFPPGVFNVVTGLGEEIAEPLVRHPRVAKITFTGSERTGRRVNALAAEAMKKVTLELGGKSPQIVFDDADLEAAARGASAGIFLSNGQSCVAGSRVLVQDTIYEAFLDRVVAIAKRARLGHPRDQTAHIGPVANRPQFEKTLSYMDVAAADGALCLLGGGPARDPPLGQGWYVQPTIYGNVANAMRIAREEVFGPVLSVLRFRDLDEAIAIANDSPYGLAAGVWTRNLRRAFACSERIDAGTIYVNNYRGVSYMSPCGGYKASGIGRENGQEAIKDYLQVKSTWLGYDATIPDPFSIGTA
jgi:aldehyde dehydrogenase (NAD+)